MNDAKHEPLEQIDYGYGYKAQNSPQQHMTLKVDGGMLAIAISLVALGGVVVGAITLPILAKNASAPADVRAAIAEREARIAQDKFTYVQTELAKKGIYISTDGH